MDLHAELRTVMGTAAAKIWRKKGFVVGEVYGHGCTNTHIAVSAKEFTKMFKVAGETTVVTLYVGAEKMPVMIRDVVQDAVSHAVIHADFQRVNMDEKMTVAVPIEFIGESEAVASGGVLVKAVSEIDVEALPSRMPHVLSVDISTITEIGQSVTVDDIILDAIVRLHVTIRMSPHAVLATVIAPRSEEEQQPVERAVEDVKVETEEIKAARDQEKAAQESSE